MYNFLYAIFELLVYFFFNKSGYKIWCLRLLKFRNEKVFVLMLKAVQCACTTYNVFTYVHSSRGLFKIIQCFIENCNHF
jgi:hypothetical protein